MLRHVTLTESLGIFFLMRERSSVHIIFHAGLAIFFFTGKFILCYLEYSWWSSEKFSQMLVHSNRKWLGTQPGWYDDQTARKLTKPFSLDLYNGSNFFENCQCDLATLLSVHLFSTFCGRLLQNGPTEQTEHQVGQAGQLANGDKGLPVQDQNKNSNKNGVRIFSKFTFQ